VLGGEPAAMARALGTAVEHRAVSSLADGARQLARYRSAGLLRVHMTEAELAALAALPAWRVPCVSTRHFAQPRGSSKAVRLATPLLRRRLARQLAISEFVAQTVGEPTSLLPNGVRDAEAGSPQGGVVLMMQRLEAEKQTDVGLRAWAASGLADEGWRLRVAGRGAQAETLRRRAGELGIEKSVGFLGFVTDTPALLAEADVFLATAPAEPFGLSLVEAMARAVPIVAAGGGAHLETVADAGELFPPGDVTACAAALVRLAHDADLRRRRGRDAQARQRGSFSLGSHVDRLVQFYEGAGR
jgi:glycosyltransferase involved in cell wall biosynthesis